MLRVRVEIVPWGMESMRLPLTTVEVTNDGTGPRDEKGHMTHGNYDVCWTGGNRRQHVGRIENFERSGENRRRDVLAAEALNLVAQVVDPAGETA